MELVDNPSAGPGNTFVEGDPQAGVEATIVPAAVMNALQFEIANVVTASGQALIPGNYGQLLAAIGGFAPWKNKLHNPVMRISQRHPVFDVTTVFGATPEYVLDRWHVDPGDLGVCQIVQRDFDTLTGTGADRLGLPFIDGQLPTYMAWTQTGAASIVRLPQLTQHVEDVRTLAGEDVVISFYGRLNLAPQAGFDTFRLELVQNFGSGGSAEVSYLSDPFEITQDGATFQRYFFATTLGVVAGKTFGPGHHLKARLLLKSGATFPLYHTGWQLERGTLPSRLEVRPREIELALCQRYFEKSYPYEVEPGTASGFAGASQGHEPGSDAQSLATRFRVEKRATPTVVFFNPATGASGALDWAGSNFAVLSVNDPSTSGTGIPNTAHGASDEPVRAHWTADAEY